MPTVSPSLTEFSTVNWFCSQGTRSGGPYSLGIWVPRTENCPGPYMYSYGPGQFSVPGTHAKQIIGIGNGGKSLGHRPQVGMAQGFSPLFRLTFIKNRYIIIYLFIIQWRIYLMVFAALGRMLSWNPTCGSSRSLAFAELVERR